MEWIEAKAQIFPAACPFCGGQATDAHHALFGRSKRFAAWVDTIYNLEPVCHECHLSGLADTLEHRREFYAKQAKRYGAALREWLERMPAKMSRTRLDFMDRAQVEGRAQVEKLFIGYNADYSE